MLLAYRRGLLKPDYPNGLQSRIRERLMLDALDIELAMDHINDYTKLIHTVLAPHYDTGKLDNVKNIIETKLELVSNLREYDIKSAVKTKSIANESSTTKLAEAFTELERRGIIKAFQEEAEKHFADLKRNKPQL